MSILSSTGYGAPVDVTRAANQTPYTAGDCVGGVIPLGQMGPVGGQILLTSARLRPVLTAVPTGMTYFTLYLYNTSPPSALADNAAWTLASGDLPYFLGSVNLGTPALPTASSAALLSEVTNIGKQVSLLTDKMWAYLVTAAGYTPAANSEVYTVTAQSLALVG